MAAGLITRLASNKTLPFKLFTLVTNVFSSWKGSAMRIVLSSAQLTLVELLVTVLGIPAPVKIRTA